MQARQTVNIVDPILFQCQRQPPVAAICVPGSSPGLISYRRLERYIHNITRRLHALGLPERSIVAVNIEDLIFHAAVVLALTRLGMVTLSLHESDGSATIHVDALITTTRLPMVGLGRVIAADLSWTEGDGLPLEPHLLPQTREDNPCRIILTSGTTGAPKAVALGHKLMTARIARHLTVFGNRLCNCSRIYSDFPLSFSLGFQFLIYTLWRGGTAFFPGDSFDNTLRAFEDHKVQCLVGSPRSFESFLRWFDVIPSYQSNIELLVCAGDILARPMADRLRARICSHLMAVYGATETSMLATGHAREIADVPQAVGYLTPGVAIQVVDDSGTVLQAGSEGRVRVRSEFAVESYFGDSDKSSTAFRDGWFYPGDLGTVNSDDLVVITGREQPVLNLGGNKVSPEIIETMISQFSGVLEAVAVPVPNEYGNNEICAVVLGKEKLDERALRAHCEARIPRQLAPARYCFPDSIPRDAMGRIDRRALRELVDRLLERRP
jgi:acyl-coenzyme A synthetase/AMP-(fatty) acid ligase